MYGTLYRTWVMFHANDYGRAGLDGSRARVAKMNLLKDAEDMALERPNHKRPSRRWIYVGTSQSKQKRSQRRVFPEDTEGG